MLFVALSPGVVAQTVDPQEAKDLTARAITLYQQGHAADAIEPARQALAIREKLLGPDSADTATSLNNLALLYATVDRFPEAEQLYRRALSIYEKVRGPDSVDTANCASNLGLLYAETGKYTEAEALYLRALAIREKALGPENVDTALSLNNLAALYESLGKYAEAESLYNKALPIYEKASGPDSPEAALAVNNLAAVYSDQGQYDRAERLYARALAIREKALGPEHPDTANSLNDLGFVCWQQGKYGPAESYYLRALAIREKIFGPNHRNVAATLTNLGALYNTASQHEKALEHYRRALTIYQNALGPDHPDTARALNNVAAAYDDMGQYARAEPLYRRALEIRQKTLGADHPDVAQSVNNLAYLCAEQGRNTEAEALYRRALAIDEKALGSDHTSVAEICNNLAEFYRNTGRYREADSLYRRALSIFEKRLGPDHPSKATVLNNLANMMSSQSQYDSAEELYRRSLAIYEKAFGPGNPKVALGLNNLVSVYWMEGEYAKGEPLGRRSVSISERELGPEHPITAAALTGLASLLVGEAKYAEAEPLLQRALAIQEKVLGADHSSSAVALNDLALLYFLQGRYRDADPLYRRALVIFKNAFGPDHPNASLNLSNLFLSEWAQGKLDEAEVFLRQSIESEEHQLELNLAMGAESQRLAYAERFAASTDAVLSFQNARKTPAMRRFAFETVANRKARVLDSLTDELASVRRRLDPAGKQMLDELTQVRAQQARLLLAGGEATTAPPEVVRSAKSREEALVRQLSEVSAAFRQRSERATIARIQAALPHGAALIEYARYSPTDITHLLSSTIQPRYGAFILQAVGDPEWVDLGDASAIEVLIARYRALVVQPGSSRSLVDAGEQLSQRLLAPVLARANRPESLLIAPDAALELIPWAALPLDSQSPLMQHFPVSLLDSSRDLLRLGDHPQPQSEGIIVADPAFDAVAAVGSGTGDTQRSRDFHQQRWSPLPGTHKEAAALQEELGVRPQQLLEHERATKAAVLAVHGPRFLHIATHGFFLQDQSLTGGRALNRGVALAASGTPVGTARENPLLRSGLVFAGANLPNGTAASILTALEASQLDLEGTELVTLSACETGLGETTTGEGVFGLRRALTLAGARAQIISLWKVDDDSTAYLMKQFYGYLVSGETRVNALRRAQQDLARKARSPYYWAAFQLAGDPGPVLFHRAK